MKVPVDPVDNMKGAEGFLLVCLAQSHCCCCQCYIFCIIEQFVKIALLSATLSTLPAPVKAMDRVCVYTVEVLTLVKTANLSLGICILKQIDVLIII